MKAFEGMKGIFELIEKEDQAAITAIFASGIDVDVPIHGRIRNDDVFMQYARKAKKWLDDNDVTVEFIDSAVNPNRAVYEFNTYYEHNGQVLDTPVGIMCELMPEGKVDEARVYYQTPYIIGKRTHRRAMFNEDKSIVSPPMHAKYFKAIHEMDMEEILSCFEEDAYFRGDSKRHSYGKGHEGLRKMFATSIFDIGCVCLKMGTVTVDDSHYIIEFLFDQYGDNFTTPQCGLAVYGVSPDGLMSYARVYDDVVLDNRLWP